MSEFSEALGKFTAGAWLVILGAVIFTSNVAIFGQDTYGVDNNWTEQGVIEGGLTVQDNGDLLGASGNAMGNWTGFVQEEPQNSVIDITIDSDVREGNGELRVRSYESNPDRVDVTSPDTIEVVPLETGTYTTTFENATQYDYFQVQIYLQDTSGNENDQPNVDSFTLSYTYQQDTIFEPGRQITQLVALLMLFIGLLMFVLAAREVN